ncbi:MAG: translation initiation factor IF-2 subunit alpha [Candidatus Aenigmatarchaeota archaeon]
MTKKEKWPSKGELVIGVVTRVNPFSAFIALEEYEGKEGMVHISEVAGKWVKDIREFVKVGKKVVALVMNVDKEKNHIALSLKRVKKYDAEEKMKEYKRELKAKKMLELVAKNLNMSLSEAEEKIGTKLEEIFEEKFKAFQLSLTQQGYDLLIKKGVPEEWAKKIKEVAQKEMEVKEVELKQIIELKCFKSDGIEIIKTVLKEAKNKYKVDIKYISAPKYSLSLKTKDAKLGERKLKEITEEIISNINKLGGEGRIL